MMTLICEGRTSKDPEEFDEGLQPAPINLAVLAATVAVAALPIRCPAATGQGILPHYNAYEA